MSLMYILSHISCINLLIVKQEELKTLDTFDPLIWVLNLMLNQYYINVLYIVAVFLYRVFVLHVMGGLSCVI